MRRWDIWDGWHEAAQQSTGIKRADAQGPGSSGEAREAYEYCLPYYYKLAAQAIPASRQVHRAGGSSNVNL